MTDFDAVVVIPSAKIVVESVVIVEVSSVLSVGSVDDGVDEEIEVRVSVVELDAVVFDDIVRLVVVVGGVVIVLVVDDIVVVLVVGDIVVVLVVEDVAMGSVELAQFVPEDEVGNVLENGDEVVNAVDSVVVRIVSAEK